MTGTTGTENLDDAPGNFARGYAAAMVAADARFAPLVAELRARGVEPLGVDQTGGMVMCLHVPLPVGQERGDYPYLYVSDDGQAGASLDIADSVGLSLDPTTLPAGEDGWTETDTRFDPDGWTVEAARLQADWLAPLVPLLADWYRENVTTTRTTRRQDMRGVVGAARPYEDVTDTDAEWSADPILPDTKVWRY